MHFRFQSMSPFLGSVQWYLFHGDQIQETLKSKMASNQFTIQEPISQEFHVCCPADKAVRIRLSNRLIREMKELPNERTLRQITAALKALAHPLRLEISLLLLQRDHCICELVQQTRKKPNLVSHHLASMRRSGIVEFHWHSGRKYCGLSKSAVRLLRGCRQATDLLTQPDFG